MFGRHSIRPLNHFCRYPWRHALHRIRLITLLSSLSLACGPLVPLRAADGAATPPATVDAATQQRAEAKAGRLVAGLNLEDPGKAARAKSIVGAWYVTMWDWHTAKIRSGRSFGPSETKPARSCRRTNFPPR